jgi:hypothetical protein
VGAWLRHQVLDDVRISPSLQIQAVTFGDPPTDGLFHPYHHGQHPSCSFLRSQIQLLGNEHGGCVPLVLSLMRKLLIV